MSFDKTILPQSGWAFELGAGERFRVEDLHGQQVSDLVVFSSRDHTDRLSQANTRKLNGRWLISKGDVLYSTTCRPLLEITEDTVGRHDLQSSCCSPYDYPIRFGVEGHPSCLAILCEQLKPFGIPEHLIPDPFNVFMVTTIDADTGEIEVQVPHSKAGDYIEFRASTDVVVAITVCPQDMNACNGGTITPLRATQLPSAAA